MIATVQRIREEAFAEAGLRIDRDKGIIHDVKVLGRDSKNGRVYTQEAMNDAAKLYEGISVNIDHRDPDDDSVRQISEQWGVLRNVKIGRDGVFADLHYIKSHPMTESLIERAERFPNNFGLSHDASGQVTEGLDGQPDMVESLDHAESVDLVSKPATNSGLFESQTRKKMPKVTVAEAVARRKTKAAKRLKSLLEMDEYSAMAEEPAEVEPEASDSSAAEDVDASIKAMVIAILDGEGDAKAKLGKIKEVLGVQEKLADAAAPEIVAEMEDEEGEDEEGEVEEGEESEEGEDEVKESVARLKRRDRNRDLLESVGLAYSRLSKVERRLLDATISENEAAELVESFKELTPARKKPQARSAFQESAGLDDLSFDDLLADAKS